MNTIFKDNSFVKKAVLPLYMGLLLFVVSSTVNAQMAIFEFTGQDACPNVNPAVTIQPANATFSNFIAVGPTCDGEENVFKYKDFNTNNNINLSEYLTYTITPNSNYLLKLDSIRFAHVAEENQSANTWYVRSSLDNYNTDIASGPINVNQQTALIILPSANFNNIGTVTFRIYVTKMKNGKFWTLDDIATYGSIGNLPNVPANPTSNSPQCSATGVTLTANGMPVSGVSWFWQTTATGTSTTNASSTNIVNISGTYYLRARHNASLLWSNGAGSVVATVAPDLSDPVFTIGGTSSRCLGAGNFTYIASAVNSTLITYSLNAASLAAGNTINATTGQVTFDALWNGTTSVTASADGCGGPKISTHIISTTPSVGAPTFALGSSSTRCQGAGGINYTATASNATSIIYSLDAASMASGNSINTANGSVTYAAAWSGAATITAAANGCNGPTTTTHTVTITPSVSNPVFTLVNTSTRCQGAGTITYDATSTNTTAITYSLNAASITGGNSINSTTGAVTYSASWSGTSTITASASGCNGPKISVHTVTVTPTVGTPVFALGATSQRCIGGGITNYTATATNNSSISYDIDATSMGAGNTINNATGAVTFSSAYTGVTTITATAQGCNGPKTSMHVITTNPAVNIPVFTLGSSSIRCMGLSTVTYVATSLNNTGITYSLDAASLSFGNTVNATTGAVNYSLLWFGTSTITATAIGCGGPLSASHIVTVTATVGTPAFALGTTSTRCQGGGNIIYAATSTNSTSIVYTLNAASITGGNTINATTGEVSFNLTWSGSSTITATAAGCNGPKTSNHVVTITPTVGTPVFTLTAISTRCQGAGTVTYTATATNSTSITYSLDATSITGGNTINSSTGAVAYAAAWVGSSIITAAANGCNGPITSTHSVTITATVTTPIFTSGVNSIRCQSAATVTYGATANNTTGITYSLNAASITGGNTINSTNGAVTYATGWSGTSTITASAAGCSGSLTATHTVTITPSVTTPIFILGATTTRCQSAATITYTASAINTTGIIYSLDAASLAAGNNINATTGAVTYLATWTGTSTITAAAAGCIGPRAATHTVTINTTVGATIFALGTTSTRCQGTGTVSYIASATNSTSITYLLDAASTTGGNTINSITGIVAYAAGWSGTTTVTATAAGCNGPALSNHVITVTPTVGTPAFTLGATSTRCQGGNTVSYTANATNSTGIIYSLNAASLTAGNTINATTGAVTYIATFNGSSIVTATVAGCNGPKTANHTVTITPTVGTPIFSGGLQSVRTQGANTTTYTATATNNTGISYTLDAASIAGGNTINTTTGAVTWSAAWFGTSVVNANAAGCNGPVSSSHIINANSSVVQSPLYLSSPGQILDRIDPVSTNITTTIQTADLSSTGTTNTTFTLNPVLCSNLTIKARTIAASIYVSITSGTMPTNPNITAQIKSGATNIITLTNPVYNSTTRMLSWTRILGADVTVLPGAPVELLITTAQAGVVFKMEYRSATKPSQINLFPVSTFVDFTSFDVYSAPYPGGTKRVSGLQNTTYYVRATVTTPFGFKDITGLDLRINPPGSTVPVTCIDSTSCTRTYQYPWTTSAVSTTYYLLGTAKQGFENVVKNSDLLAFDVCSVCPPVTTNDSAIGSGGSPIIVNVSANDYDPNNNLKLSTLSIATQPNNGTGYVSNNKIVYLPNGTFAGKDTLRYSICDSTGLCSTASVFFTINPLLIDPCSEATRTHTYFIPYPEKDSYISLLAASNQTMPSNNIRTVISLTMPYPGMTIVWDEWEDGYETNALNPTQASTKVWGDGNPYNGIAPGYATDIIPAGGSIILDNTMPANPRVQANIFYDGRDKITGSGQVAITQVSGEPTRMPVQAIKTNVTSTFNFGNSFTIPLGENFASRDFLYTALFIRAELDSTVVDIDKDNNGTFETNVTLNEGESYLLNGGVKYGATVTSTKPVGVELNAGGIDDFSIRNAPIYPATWYSNTYYTPVSTSDNAGDNPKDSSVVMLYNSLNRPITINWNSGIPTNGTILLPAKTSVRFPLAYSTTSAYKFFNPTGESFTAIEIVDSYTPGGGGNSGLTYDWSFNLIAEARLTDFATTAWAPGGLDLVAPPGPDVNGNPIWVTPNVNTTIYVKWDGKVSGTTGSVSPCGLRFDSSFTLNALKYSKIRDNRDFDQSGIAIYTCNGAKIAAVYGEDPEGSGTGIGVAYWDVGTTILPFCKQKLIFANDDYARTVVSQAVTIPILLNDFGFLAVVDPTSVTTTALLQPKNGTVTINANGTMIYLPNPGYVGKDTLEYNVCSTPSPIVCDIATVYIDISACPAPFNQNLISGQVFLDKNDDGINNDGNIGVEAAKVYLYVDGNCNTIIDANELKDSVTVDASGTYQFITYPEKTVEDDFDGVGGARTCANGTDGNAAWSSNWVDAGDNSVGFCNTTQSAANTDAEIVKDGSFTNALRLKDRNVSATRTVNLTGASYAFLSFSYRRKSSTLTAGEDIIVQASTNGTTFATVFTIAGGGTADAAYVDIFNQDITAYKAPVTFIRFLTNNNVDDADTVYIDNVKIQFISYPLCYMTALDVNSVPANYRTTTILKHNLTATSLATCLAPYNFGIAKNTISISGALFNDANGNMDNLINGTPLGTISGSTVYAYLVDSTGKVAHRTILNTTNGTYSFSRADVYTTYTLSLSTVSVNLGDSPPPVANPGTSSGSWTNTGDGYGTNNMAGSGIKAGLATCSILVKTAATNINAVNFGIERLPDSDDRLVNYTVNTPGLKYDITGGLTGSDAEDGILGATKTYKITSLPANAVLFYNNVVVTNNQVIPNFNPLLLKIDPADNILITTFKYAAMDAAGLYDPAPATVTVRWVSVLPVTLVNFNGRLNGSKVDLFWSTSAELNTSHFEVERSTDAQTFTKIAKVNAKGSTSSITNYTEIDPIPEIGLNYYRLKIIDRNGTFVYSNIVQVKTNLKIEMVTKVKPNPFTGRVDVYLSLEYDTKVQFHLFDFSGKRVYTKEVKGLKGFNLFTLDNLEKLPTATYVLKIVTEYNTLSEKIIKQ